MFKLCCILIMKKEPKLRLSLILHLGKAQSRRKVTACNYGFFNGYFYFRSQKLLWGVGSFLFLALSPKPLTSVESFHFGI